MWPGSEIGVNGLKAQDINSNAQQDSIEEHEKQLEVLWSIVKTLQDSADESRNRNPLSSSD
jgi:hypothetical protein